MTLNLMQIRAFIAVIDTGGFQEAARWLDCSQPTVTQLVRKLETQLAVQLIIRHRGAPVATRHGDLFLPHARRLLRAEERAVASITARTLMVGASGNVGTYLLPPLLRSFRDSADIDTDLVIAPNPEISDRIESGDIDIAVLEWWDGRAGFIARPWRRERMVVIVPPDHIWAAQDEIPRDWLLDTPMIGGEPGSGTGRLLQEAYGKDADHIRVSMNLGSTAAVKEAVKAGLGISIVLRSTVMEDVQAGTLRAIDLAGAAIEKELMIVLPENVPDNAPSARFQALLVPSAVAPPHLPA